MTTPPLRCVLLACYDEIIVHGDGTRLIGVVDGSVVFATGTHLAHEMSCTVDDLHRHLFLVHKRASSSIGSAPR
jgi:hypothetical protein